MWGCSSKPLDVPSGKGGAARAEVGARDPRARRPTGGRWGYFMTPFEPRGERGRSPTSSISQRPGRPVLVFVLVLVAALVSVSAAADETVVTAPPLPAHAPREDQAAAASVVLPDDSPRARDDLGTLLSE